MRKSGIELIDRTYSFRNRTAIIDPGGRYSYEDLLYSSVCVAGALLENRNDLYESRVCFLVAPGFVYAAVKFGIWRAGGISVPLCTFHPESELEYTISDSQADTVITEDIYLDRVRGIAEKMGVRVMPVDYLLNSDSGIPLPEIDESRRAMMLYTSGTTSRPKGVVTTHRNLKAQITSLVKAWEWNRDDYILNMLPLHHLHGILNLLLCPLWSGAVCELLPEFDEKVVWEHFRNKPITLFMGVPTMYYRLIDYWECQDSYEKKILSERSRKLRLMVSGSAALPVKTFEKWRSVTGHTLLERYGMTEIGMALSNPLHGKRIPGSVGKPLPGVKLELFDENERIIGAPEQPGEIRVKGDGVFLEYWNRPEDTKKAFADGWFKTGDIALRDQDGNYRIMGRDSVDIIKSGGYKISALEIEEVLRNNPSIKECCVVGIPDEEWGERVAAVIIPEQDRQISAEAVREWSRQKLAVYKIPTRYRFVNELPRNIMGKVLKNRAKELF